MEITKEDLKFFKLSPSLICLLKCIHFKDDDYLKELDKITSVEMMAKHLQDKLIIKVVDDKVETGSYEIRKVGIIKYLSEKNAKHSDEAKMIFDFFIKTKEKYSQKKSGMKFNTYKDWLKSRVKAGVSFEDASAIVKMKFEQWYGGEFQIHLNFQTLLGPKHYLKNVQQLELSDKTTIKDFSDDI